MGYGLPLIASARYETLGAGTGTGTTVTAGGSNNTKGNYATLGTTSFQYDGIELTFSSFSSANRYRIDIAINTTADTIIIPDLFVDCTTNGSSTSTSVFIPISVPTGAAVKARCQSNSASATVNILATGYQTDSKGMRGFARCVSCTDWTNTDPTGSVTLTSTTLTGWAQVQASTTARIAALYAAIDARGVAMTGSVDLLFDIGWGSAGNERQLARFLMRSASAHQQIFGPFPCDFPSGTRLAFRAQASTTDTNTLSMALFGLAL